MKRTLSILLLLLALVVMTPTLALADGFYNCYSAWGFTSCNWVELAPTPQGDWIYDYGVATIDFFSYMFNFLANGLTGWGGGGGGW